MKNCKTNISRFRKIINRPLTISEKILIGHLDKNTDFGSGGGGESTLFPANDYVLLNPDRVALQDVTGQMTILQFVQAGLKRTSCSDNCSLRSPYSGTNRK